MGDEWLGGLGGGLDALAQILAQRKAERLHAEAVKEQIRQFNVQAEERSRQHLADEAERLRYHTLVGQQRQDTLQAADQARREARVTNLVTGETPPGYEVSPEEAADIRGLGHVGAVRTTAATKGGPPVILPSGMLTPEVPGTLAALPGGLMPNPPQPERHTLPAGGFAFQRREADRVAAEAKAAEAQQAKEEFERQRQAGEERLARITASLKPHQEKFVKVTTRDEQGRAIEQYVPESVAAAHGPYQKPMGAVIGARVALATGAVQTGQDLIAQLSRPEVRAKLGPVMGRAANLEAWLGTLPPELSDLRGNIESFARVNQGIHGMRSDTGAGRLVRDLFERKMTPDTLIAAVRGLNRFAQHLIENEGIPLPEDKTPAVPSSIGPRRLRYNPATGVPE